MKAKKLLRQTFHFYGRCQQTLKTVEELSELASALMHFRDGKASQVKVANELADVEIMCRKMRILLGKQVCQEAKKKKLKRLARTFKEDKKVVTATTVEGEL